LKERPQQSPGERHLGADLWLLLAAFFWGLTFVSVKDAMRFSSPLLFLGTRFALASLVLLPFCYRSLRRLDRSGWRDGILLGMFLFGGYAFQTAGLVHTTATRSAFITGLTMILVPPLSVFMLRKKSDLLQIAGVFLAVVGLYVFVNPEAGPINRGDFLTIFCTLCFAMQIVLVQRATLRHKPLDMVMIQLLTTVLLSFSLSPFMEKPFFHWSSLLGLDLLFTSLLATVGCLLIQFTFQRKTSPTRAAVIYATEPLFAALFGFLFFGEHLGAAGWLGGSLILAGMVISELSPR
jgi:drug/metabolite transporter (DMT)-like permease